MRESKVGYRFRDGGELTGKPPLREFREVVIEVPWGQMVGKWYGPLNVRPVLGLHGWLDNAGSYDYLAAMLPANMAFLSVDLPGHGLSTHLPKGVMYSLEDNTFIIQLIMKHFKWRKVSLIAHSMSGAISFIFASVFPNLVDMVIGIEALTTHQRPPSATIRLMETRSSDFLRELERATNESEAPSYTFEELVDRLYEGSFQSVPKDRAQYILARNIKRSEKFEDRYCFTRDRRIMFYNDIFGSPELCIEMAKRINCPYMLIRCENSPYFVHKKNIKEVIQIMSTKPHFQLIERPGTHHIHFGTPERIIEPVLEFLGRHAVESFKTEQNHNSNKIMPSKL